jgi:hypothetical protein
LDLKQDRPPLSGQQQLTAIRGERDAVHHVSQRRAVLIEVAKVERFAYHASGRIDPYHPVGLVDVGEHFTVDILQLVELIEGIVLITNVDHSLKLKVLG